MNWNGAYQERSPLGVLHSAPHEYYSMSQVMGFGFGDFQERCHRLDTYSGRLQ